MGISIQGALFAADETDYRTLINRAASLLNEQKYDEYIALFDPDSVATEIIKNNIQQLVAIKDSIVTMKNSFVIGPVFGEDQEYISYRAVQEADLVILIGGERQRVTQKYDVFIVIRKDLMKISGYLPGRNIATVREAQDQTVK